MNATKGVDNDEDSRQPTNNNLDGRYREIGISAVAAAVRFQSEKRNPAPAPALRTAATNAYGCFAEA